MDKTYSPHAIERKNYQFWEENNYFAPHSQGNPFCIMLPPPNVTGSLHMGHGFQHTLIDTLIRYKRMMGYKTLWQPGTDHAGISTQLVVEGQLEEEGLSRKQLTREAFLDRVWSWKEQSGDNITRQMRRMGSSPDWTRQRFTMDEGLSQAVLKVFVQLFEEGLIYRGTRLVNWDVKLGTAISDLEVISSEEDGFLWHIRYPIKDSEKFLTVATTRPETMLGDVAVAVHPQDERYQDLIGKFVGLPICNREIPIIADEYVEKDFGSGCVKITPAHDFNDYAIGKRHNLEQINILTPKGTINENAPKEYQGLEVFEARKKILKDLDELKLLEKTEPYKIKVPRGEKSNTIIEPLLTEQWYVKIKPLAKPAIDAVKNGEVRFIPENWSKTYFQWMENIEDWCISRQLWWGHRIPAWYDEDNNVYVGYSEDDVRFKHKLDDTVTLRQDEDVLDTWFSSALWPFTSLGWPEKTKELEEFYPTQVLFTGFDIINFWVARMIMMGLKFTGKVPFSEVVITGLICDKDGKKMSKSKGNVLDPLDIIDGIDLDSLITKRTSHLMIKSMRDKIAKETRKEFPEGIQAYGADALRFTYCSLASSNRVVRFDLNRVEGYRNFCNKLWNAARFVVSNTSEETQDFGDGAFQYSPQDMWILSELQRVKSEANKYFEIYRFDLLAALLYDFVWHEYCDWYLELSKSVLYNESALAPLKRGTRRTLIHVLDNILKLLHPIIPFITEEIWQKISKLVSENGDTIMLAKYPLPEKNLINQKMEHDFAWIKRIVGAIRNIKADLNVSPQKSINVLVRTNDTKLMERFNNYLVQLDILLKINSLSFIDEDENNTLAASAVVDGVEILVPMADLINKEDELARLEKEINKISKDIEFLTNKLENPNFKDKAPAAIIKKEEEKLEAAINARDKLVKHRETIETL